MYIHIYIHIHICTQAYIHLDACIDVYTYIHVCMTSRLRSRSQLRLPRAPMGNRPAQFRSDFEAMGLEHRGTVQLGPKSWASGVHLIVSIAWGP